MTSPNQNEIPGIPSYANIPTGVFRDIGHYKNVLAGITRGLAREGGGRKGQHSRSSSYLFDVIAIDFTTTIKSEEIFLDYLNSKIILRAPKKPSESAKSLLNRRMYYLGVLLREIEAMKAIGISQIYLALKPSGRDKLDKIRKQRKKPSVQRK